MPLIKVELFEGRTLDQKRELVSRITKDVCDVIGCPPEAVKIVLRDMKRENYAEDGKLFCDK